MASKKKSVQTLGSPLKPNGLNASSVETLHVLCRFRPPYKKASSVTGAAAASNSNVPNMFSFPNDSSLCIRFDEFETKQYTFDSVFNSSSTQLDIFKKVENVVYSVMDGFNATILAYGQTSSGKTHTMEGPNIRASVNLLKKQQPHSDQPPPTPEELAQVELLGIIPRTINLIFETIHSSAYKHTDFIVIVSYFEIYCEKLRDLLNPAQDNMKLREYSNKQNGGTGSSSALNSPHGPHGTNNNTSGSTGFMVQDVTEVYCKDSNDVFSVINRGKGNRATAPTLMNAESSRSHSILLIKINQKTRDGDDSSVIKKDSRLYLVDLAGSEKVGKTGATGERLKEAQNINKSLTTFGMVINALSERSKHVPYRDSKLTKVLQDSIGGNSKTTLIMCCSGDNAQITETLSTLRFGERAKRIENNIHVNAELSINEYKALLLQAKKEILMLKQQLKMEKDTSGDVLVNGDNSDTENSGTDEIDSNVNDDTDATDIPNDETKQSISMEEHLMKMDDFSYRMATLTTQLEECKLEISGINSNRSQLETSNNLQQVTINQLQDKLFSVRNELKEKEAVIDHLCLNLNLSDLAELKTMVESLSQAQSNASQHNNSIKTSSSNDAGMDGEASEPVSTREVDVDGGKSAQQSCELANSLVVSLKDQQSEYQRTLEQKIQALSETLLHMRNGQDDQTKQNTPITVAGVHSNSNEAMSNLLKQYEELKTEHVTQTVRVVERLNEEQTVRLKIQSKYEELQEKYMAAEEAIESLNAQVEMYERTGGSQNSNGFSLFNKDITAKNGQEKSNNPLSKWAMGTATNFFNRYSSSNTGGSRRDSTKPPGGSGQMYQLYKTQAKQIQNLSQQLEEITSKYHTLEYDHECSVEQNVILLEVKDKVLESLVAQNQVVEDERDAYARQIDELSSTVEQLTTLLRNSMQMQQSYSNQNQPPRVLRDEHAIHGGQDSDSCTDEEYGNTAEEGDFDDRVSDSDRSDDSNNEG